MDTLEDLIGGRTPMICENCDGRGVIYEYKLALFTLCRECGGLRRTSCCEGSYRHGQAPDTPWVDWPPDGLS